MLSGINHINIVVEDLEATAAFFVNNFGFTAGPQTALTGPWVDQLTGYKEAAAAYIPLHPPAGSTSSAFEILKYITPASPPLRQPPGLDVLGFRHVGFNVDDIDAMVTSLTAQGYKFFSEPVLVPEMNLRTVYFYGPEQIILQLTEVLLHSQEDPAYPL
jgi:catechol 2,3-dioxygenase-like lactoylglutathione lyase family enzyme